MSNEHQRMIFRENRIRLQLKEELETELGIQERKIEEQKTESSTTFNRTGIGRIVPEDIFEV
jgi:hypothetical protein